MIIQILLIVNNFILDQRRSHDLRDPHQGQGLFFLLFIKLSVKKGC